MVIVRIKNDRNNNIDSKKITNDSISIISDLKLCHIINDNDDLKVEKKIEFENYKNNIIYDDNIIKYINGPIFSDFRKNGFKSKYIISIPGNKHNDNNNKKSTSMRQSGESKQFGDKFNRRTNDKFSNEFIESDDNEPG